MYKMLIIHKLLLILNRHFKKYIKLYKHGHLDFLNIGIQLKYSIQVHKTILLKFSRDFSVVAFYFIKPNLNA